ncbi:leucine-rich receptor-like protein kinase family protein [Striga asiatica]|uniref:Leucine-rich receptor-like protein kinase family protein n=1 Tax=Striga asiatica TaxID=4170 RepID=A0A5A7P3X0_STRAF|nr:leucine-rich receptor-like protein kinase family protein [Striga asiatica]
MGKDWLELNRDQEAAFELSEEVGNLLMNGFTGPAPRDLGRFSPLDTIDISENRFSIRVPLPEGELAELNAICSNLRGEIPESIFELEALLCTLDICRSEISGRSIGKLKSFRALPEQSNGDDCPTVNRMSGEILYRTGNLTRLTVFRNNGFGEMCNLISFAA